MSYTRTDEILLHIDHVSMSYGSNQVLKDVNTTIHKFDHDHDDRATAGRIICFLGPSGSGKSTVSRIVSGLEKPTSGRVLLFGDKPVKPGDVSMVPQNYPMFEYFTVAQNLEIAGKMGKLTHDDINLKATEYIREFGLEAHLTKYPRELSGGTRQRVSIARQLLAVSNYMVMDEPFSGLDPVTKTRAMDAIIKLGSIDAYHTIIIVTHDLISGMAISDKVWLLGHGVIVEEIDLAEMGLAWRPDIKESPDFQSLVSKVEKKFITLS